MTESPARSRLGQGTWRMGEDPRCRDAEVAALHLGLDLGLTIIDTAEMYADGCAEEVVGQAIRSRRDEAFLVSKVLPQNATRDGTVAACERSLRRLGVETLDLYLLHWREDTPLAETLAAFVALKQAGKIRAYGVSNFDVTDMVEALAAPGGDGIVANQVLYNLAHRGIERNLLPWCAARGITIQAYAPVRRFDLAGAAGVAERHGVTAQEIALAWTLRQPGVVALVKASDPEHVRSNAAAAKLVLDARDLADLDVAYPRPERDVPLAML